MNYLCKELLDGYDDEEAPTAAVNTSSATKNIKSTDPVIDIWNDNFAKSQILDFTNSLALEDDEDDDDLGANSIDSDDSENEDEESDDANLWREKSLASEAQLTRDTEHLIKEFHQAEINITEEGTGNVIEDAVDERRDGYIRLFMHADRVYSSPLTRAMQTALLSMEDHRAMNNNGLILYR